MWSTDFPDNFVNRQHPEDYILVPEPIVPEYILHTSILHGSIRLFVRISWKTPRGFLPMTFMVDTTNPYFILFCPEGMMAIINNDRRHSKDHSDLGFVQVHHGRSGEEEVFFNARMDYSQVKSVNIIGLRGLMKLGLHVDSKGFRFDNSIPWF